MDQIATPVLEARDIGKHFAGVSALRDVDFALQPGEGHALVGENGAGKSTLIKVLTGVYQPDAGELRLGGQPIHFAQPLDAQAAGISTIYQEVNLVPLMSAAQNIYLGREPRNRLGLIDFAAMREMSHQLLSGYGIKIDVRRPLRTLGLGAQQMVALARSVSIDARVVIMDEPTSSLEPREVDTLFDVIGRLRADGIAIVYVSHRMDELYEVCERVTVLRDGKLVHTGALSDTPRLELISLMLGRSTSEVSAGGVTQFDADRTRSGAAVLDVEGLTRKHEIDGIDLHVRSGEVLGLGGLLGAGRTETLKAIAGASTVDRGTVKVGDHAVRGGSVQAAIHAGIVLLPEDRKAEGIIPHLSVRENIVLAAMPQLSRFGFTSRKRQDAVVATMMSRLRIKASSPQQPVAELSGGNQQKVMIARWLAMNPKVLLLDEPTRGIDVGAKAEVQSLINELAVEGLAIILVSSEIEEVLEGADRMLVLKDGAIVAELDGDGVTEEALMAALASAPDQPAEETDG